MSGASYYLGLLEETEPKTFSVSVQISPNTVKSAVEYCEQHNLNLNDVKFGHGYVSHKQTETPEQVQERLERIQRILDTHLEFIRNAYHAYVDEGFIDE